MLPKKHLVCRKTDGLYFFRSSIPKDLGSLLKGKKEFRLSLHTQDLSRASVQAQKYYHVTQGIYQQMRIGHFMTDSVSFIKTWIIQVLENDQKGNLSNQTPYAKRYHDFSLVNDVNMPQEKVATLSEVYQKYKYEMIQVDAWAIKTSMEYDSCVGLAIEVIGDLPMNQIQRSQISRYKEILLKLPANRRKDPRYRELGIQEVIKVHQGPSISVSTVNKHIKCMSALFHWTNRNIHPLDNYFEGLKLHKKVKSNSERWFFSAQDLQKIFAPEVFTAGTKGQVHRFWVPLLGLYTGARLNELCQLHLSDVRQEQGVWVLDINDRQDDPDHPKRLKNASSERLIPIHPKLIKLGFLDYLKQQNQGKHIRLFSELKWNPAEGYGRNVGRWFNEQYLRRDLGITDKKKIFHSFRHTVANHLKQKGVAESFIGELLGHSSGSITMDRYGKSFRPEVLLKEAVEKLEFELKLERLKREW